MPTTSESKRSPLTAKCATAIATKSKTQNEIHQAQQQPQIFTADGGWFNRSGNIEMMFGSWHIGRN